VLFVILLAAAGSCLLRYAPLFARLSSGLAMIICAVLAAFTAALCWPAGEVNHGGR
jgi:hypothetical protein